LTFGNPSQFIQLVKLKRPDPADIHPLFLLCARHSSAMQSLPAARLIKLKDGVCLDRYSSIETDIDVKWCTN